MSLSVSLYVICITFFLAVPAQLYFLFVSMGVNRNQSILIASTCYFFSYFILQTINFASELLFVSITLISVGYIANIKNFDKIINPKCLMMIGVLAGLSMLVRYAGIFYIISLVGFFAYIYFIQRNSSSFRNLIILSLSASIIPILLFLRNYYYTGTLTGGPNVIEGSSVIETMYAIRWQLSMLFGLFINGFNFGAAEVLFFLALLYMVFVGVTSHKKIINLLKVTSHRLSDVSKFSLIYIFTTILILLYFSFTKSDGYFNARYLMVLFPFVLIVLSGVILAGVDSWMCHTRNKTFILFILMTFMAGQYKLYKHHMSARMSESTTKSLIEPINSVVLNNFSLKSFLEETVTEKNPLLTNKAQRLWVMIKRPLVSFTPNLFTQTIWDNLKTKELVDDYNIKYILLYKKYFDNQSKAYDNQLFYKNIIRGKFPDWINVLHDSDDILLMEVM